MSANTVPCHSRLPGGIMQMGIYLVLNLFQIIGGNLSGHVNGNPVLQPQHHILHRTLHIMDNVNMKTFFQHHGKTEHIFLGKFLILCHVLHRHITAQMQRLHGFR